MQRINWIAGNVFFVISLILFAVASNQPDQRIGGMRMGGSIYELIFIVGLWNAVCGMCYHSIGRK